MAVVKINSVNFMGCSNEDDGSGGVDGVGWGVGGS